MGVRSYSSLLRLALPAVLLISLAAAAVGRQPPKSDSVVKIKATADKPDAAGKQLVTIALTIDPGWHLYANPCGNKDLSDAEVVIKVLANDKPLDAKIDYPDGKVVEDKITGNYRVYKDKVVIKATVQRDKGDTAGLQVGLKLNSCSDKMCLLPAEVKVDVK